MRLCVFCGSSPGRSPDYAAAARRVGALLARRGIGLVYGGGNVGLMGIVADAVLADGGEVVGVIPRALVDRELAHGRLSELVVVDTMHERKQRMHDLSDGFIALPGGFGTLDELFEALTWAQLGMHQKPCGLLDVNDFFAPLRAFIERQLQ
ncbi:MAG TPA: TIGR00730 family Rossman fold protein, partial [Polyangia bacterium]